MIRLSFYNLGSWCTGKWSLTMPLVISGPNLVLHAGEGRFVFAIPTTLVVGGGAGWSGRGGVWSVSRRRLFGRGQLGNLSLECDDFSFFGGWLVPGLL
jgi:hypothetical protein